MTAAAGGRTMAMPSRVAPRLYGGGPGFGLEAGPGPTSTLPDPAGDLREGPENMKAEPLAGRRDDRDDPEIVRLFESAGFQSWIEPEATGSFQVVPEFAPGRVKARLMPVRDRWDRALDIVAWQASAPGDWWLLRQAFDILGERYLASRCGWGLAAPEPVHLVGTPERWLAERGQAVCVLNWKINPKIAFAGAAEIVCATTALRLKLVGRLAQV